jgi:L-fucose isomerase-like protein
MKQEKMIIGYAPTRREVFSQEAAIQQRALIFDTIKNFQAQIVDIDDINDEGLLFNEDDLDKIISKFKAAGVDGVFFPHCNFGTEDLVAKVAQAVGKPVLIWGPRDDSPLDDGQRTRDSQCGLFATGKILRRFNVPFTYIVNCHPQEELFKRNFQVFIAVCSVVKAFRNMRILQIAPRPAGFWSVICNEGELLEKFGISIFPITLQDLVRDVETVVREKETEYLETRQSMVKMLDTELISDDALSKLAALKVSITRLCTVNHCSAAAIQCWHALQGSLQIMPCIVNGLLFDEWMPVTCETDIHGAISSIILQEAAMRSSPVFFADLTIRHPDNQNAELLWHCGNFPPSLARCDTKRSIGYHFIMPGHCPGTGEWELKGGDITVCQMGGDHGTYSLLFGEGHSVPGPKTRGTYVWFEVKDWPKWEEKFVTGPYIHHCAGIHGRVAPVLLESCKYIPGLIADPIEPTTEEIMRWLRGSDLS